MISLPAHNPARQVGFSLFMAMIFLIVLSLLAVFAIRGVMTGTRMATNMQDWNLAFQSAEAALRDAEMEDLRNGLEYTVACIGGRCLPGTSGISVWADLAAHNTIWQGADGSSNTSTAYGANTGAAALPGRLRQPRYIIEFLGPVGEPESLVIGDGKPRVQLNAYRITAAGFGRIQNNDGNPATRVVLQSIVKR